MSRSIKKGPFVNQKLVLKVEKYKKLEILRIAATGKRGKRLVVEIFDKVAQDVILNYIENPTESHHQDYYFLEYSTFKKMLAIHILNYILIIIIDIGQTLNSHLMVVV